MKRILLFLSILLFSIGVFAQGEIPVNMYTGTPGIFIKLYTLTDHDLSESISLAYNVNDVNLGGLHTYGVGWDLTVGGQIAREVRGLPDDFAGTGTDTRRGWLYSNNYSSILGFANSSDLSTVTCSDEQADYTFISNLEYNTDTEPDLFSFSVGSYSGHFVFSNNGTISLIPYQDILIVPTYAGPPSDMTITGWTITTNTGVVYSFNESCNTTRSLTKTSDYLNTGIDQTSLTMFEREYETYRQASSYFSTWMLSKVQSPTGANIIYTYSASTNTSIDPRYTEIFDAYANAGGVMGVNKTYFSLMTERVVVTRKTVSTITTSSGMWASCDPINGIKIYDPVRSTSSFKNFILGYTASLLTSVTESDLASCTQMPPYKLYYNREGNYPIGGSLNQDFWGFFNGANNTSYFPTIYVYPTEPGNERYRLYPIPEYSGTQVVLNGDANRAPDANAITEFTLSRLVYPEGGESDFTFEANQFYDLKAGKDQLGGGIRIKSVTYFDGVNDKANITKNFSYADVNGHSSGRLISRPAFALPVWQYKTPTTYDGSNTYTGYTTPFNASTPTNTQWRQVTAVTSFDISAPDNTNGSMVGYTRVTVSRPGSGKAVFDYFVPAAYGDAATGSNPTDWSPTIMKPVRPSTCPSMNIITKGEAWGYPTFSNAFYDYERGLLQKKSEFNNSGVLVRLTQNTYQYLYKSGLQPTNVVGLAYDQFANTAASDFIFLAGRYSLLADVAKVVSSETVTTYDENNAARYATENTQYNYASAYHKLVSRINETAADGTIYGTSFKYTLDYPVTATTPSDSSLWMIQLLKNASRNAVVIEQVNTVQLPGSSEKTTAATLVKFRPFNYNKPLLRYQMAFKPASAVTDFAPSGVNNYAFTNDSRYETLQTFNEYTAYDLPLSSTGQNRSSSGTLWGYNKRLPVAQFRQARAICIGFSDFETITGSEFTVTNGYYGSGRTGVNGVHPYATLERTIARPANATNYLLSFWLKNLVNTNITLQVTLKDGNGTILSATSYTYNLTSADYQYFTQAINVSAMPSTFTIQVQGQSLTQPATSSPSLLPMMDDVSFYPDYSTLSTVTYDIPFGVNSSTDPSGMTSYTSYDPLGRIKMITDQDHNIRQRYTYALDGQVLPSLVASVSGSGPYYISEPIQFAAAVNTCISGAMYAWDFQDGNGFISSGTTTYSPPHSWTAPGNYAVTLRVSHPDYVQSVMSTLNFTVGLRALAAEICGSGVQTFTSGVVTSSYTCFTHAYGDNWVAFKVNSVTNQYNATLSYQWKKRNVGTTTWNLTGPNSATLPEQKVDIVTPSFEIMCTITASDGRTADSGTLSVTVTN